MLKIVIADDHQMFTEGILMLLQANGKIQCMGVAGNGKELLELVAEHHPDLVLCDIMMPDMDGLEATQLLKAQYPELKILILTMHSTAEHFSALLEAGANGYLLKDSSKNELLTAIETIQKGEAYYDPSVTTNYIKQNIKTASSKLGPIELTSRERDVLELIMQEYTTQEIADKLFVAQSTVITHRRNLLQKTGARNTAGLVKYTIEQKLLDKE